MFNVRFAFFSIICYNSKVLPLKNFRNHLDSQVFPSSDDWKDFSHVLETIDHINIESLPRQQYIEKGSNIYESYQEKSGEMYNRLFMPEDVTYGELLFFIDFLTQKFQIEAYSKFDTILTKVKILIWLVLRESENDSMILTELAQRYNLDNGFLNRISNHPLRLDAWAREFISELRRNTKSKIENITPVEAGTQILSNALKNEFSFNFLRRGLEIVRMGMMTMTQEEQELARKNAWDIRIHFPTWELDTEERLLREKIGIDQFKEMLDTARKSWNSANIEKIEKKALDIISRTIYEYPYQLTAEKHGYQLSMMKEKKELFCVWTAILGHAFLSELQIRHRWVEESWHARLDVYIWKDIYSFDPSLYSEVRFNWNDMWIVNNRESISWDTEHIMFAQIMNSKWIEFLSFWERQAKESKYQEAIILLDYAIRMLEMSIEFFPWFNKTRENINYSIVLRSIWQKRNMITIFQDGINNQ